MRTVPRRKCLLGQPNTGWDRRSFLGPLRAREETARKLRQWDSPIATALTIAPEPYALNHTGTACPPDRLQETEENRPAPVRPSGPTHEPSVTRCARHRRLGQASHVVRLKRRRAVGRNTHDGCATIVNASTLISVVLSEGLDRRTPDGPCRFTTASWLCLLPTLPQRGRALKTFGVTF
jgi:hypothetical protein